MSRKPLSNTTDLFCPSCRQLIRPRGIWHKLKEKLLGSRPQATYEFCSICGQDLNIRVPVGLEEAQLISLSIFERFITSPPIERARLLGFPPEGWTIADLKGEARIEWLHWLEGKLPEDDFEYFIVGLIQPLILIFYHSAYASELSSVHVALQQKLWDIGFANIENSHEFWALRKSEIMGEIYKEYLVEVNYVPYPPNYELTTQFESGTLQNTTE